MARSRITHEVDNMEIAENSRNEYVRVFAETLNQLLVQKKVHQDDLASAIGVSTGSISDYRRGKKEPKLSTLIKLAEFLGVDCHYLMTGGRSENAKLKRRYGLTDKSIEFLKRETQHNLMYWRMDMVNFLLEHDAFPFLLDFLIGYATARGKKIDGVPAANGYAPVISDRDIFKAKLDDLFNSITQSTAGMFRTKPDDRGLYQTYYALYHSKGSKVKGNAALKKEMETNGLIFDQNLFRETDTLQRELLESLEGGNE